MNDTRCAAFFRQPTQTLHRQYEALRAVFLDHQPVRAGADQFGYSYGGLRNLVADFRACCATGRGAPFLPSRRAAARPARPWPRPSPRPRRLPTAGNSP
jgi:hypothetical protein